MTAPWAGMLEEGAKCPSHVCSHAAWRGSNSPPRSVRTSSGSSNIGVGMTLWIQRVGSRGPRIDRGIETQPTDWSAPGWRFTRIGHRPRLSRPRGALSTGRGVGRRVRARHPQPARGRLLARLRLLTAQGSLRPTPKRRGPRKTTDQWADSRLLSVFTRDISPRGVENARSWASTVNATTGLGLETIDARWGAFERGIGRLRPGSAPPRQAPLNVPLDDGCEALVHQGRSLVREPKDHDARSV